MRSRFVIFAALLGSTAACGALVGIRDLEVSSSGIEGDGGPLADGSTTEVDADHDGPVESGLTDGGLDGAATRKRVFVTVEFFNGALGGPQGADEKCMVEAVDAGLAGQYLAWVSIGDQTAFDRIEHEGPYYRIDDERVVANRAQLALGELEAPITITAKRRIYTGGTLVWTGTQADGTTASFRCGDFGTNVGFGVMGDINQRNASWTANPGRPNPPAPFPAGTWDCGQPGRLYCFER